MTVSIPPTARRGIPLSRKDLVTMLSEQILSGTYSPGSKLPSERHLSEQYGVSRPILREGLRSLAERGLIEIVAARGAFVRTAGSSDLADPMDAIARQQGATPRHLVEARAMLERQTAALAAERAGATEIAAMESAVDAFERSPDVLSRARSDLAFHALIAKASRNPVIETMFGSIAPLIFEMQLRSLDDPEISGRGGPLHGVVLQAIRDHDSHTASEAMHSHVVLAYELFGEDLDSTLDAIARRKVARLFGAGTTLEDVIADVIPGYSRP